MLQRVVEAREYQHKVSGAVFAQAMREAVAKKDEELFRRMANGLTRAVGSVAPDATVSVALGGPFKEVLGGDAFGSKCDVIIYLLSDELDIDSKQIVAIKHNSRNVSDAEAIFRATYKLDPLIG